MSISYSEFKQLDDRVTRIEIILEQLFPEKEKDKKTEERKIKA